MNELITVDTSGSSALDIFNFDGAEVRTVAIQGEPWFVASDVAKVLEYRVAGDMVRNLDDYEKGTQIVRTLGGDQEMLVINESGLYSAVIKSRKPEAKQFKRWVTETLLPGLRKKEFVHISDVQISGNVLAQMAASYEALSKDMAELKAAFHAGKPAPAKSLTKQVTKSGSRTLSIMEPMSKEEVRRKGLLSTSELAKKIGTSRGRLDAILDVLELHERISNAYVTTKKGERFSEVVCEQIDRYGNKVQKRLWKESVVSKLPEKYQDNFYK